MDRSMQQEWASEKRRLFSVSLPQAASVDLLPAQASTTGAFLLPLWCAAPADRPHSQPPPTLLHGTPTASSVHFKLQADPLTSAGGTGLRLPAQAFTTMQRIPCLPGVLPLLVGQIPGQHPPCCIGVCFDTDCSQSAVQAAGRPTMRIASTTKVLAKHCRISK